MATKHPVGYMHSHARVVGLQWVPEAGRRAYGLLEVGRCVYNFLLNLRRTLKIEKNYVPFKYDNKDTSSKSVELYYPLPRSRPG